MQNEPTIPSECEPRLLFVVGIWRSGTSLVHALFNRHPEVALMYEAEPLVLWPRRMATIRPGNWPQRLEFYNQTFTRHDLQPERFTPKTPGPEGALALYREYARRRGAIIMGEKAPSYYTRLQMLGNAFPNAQFLIVWRDPLECCRSALRAARTNRFFAQRGMIQRMLLETETFARGVEELSKENKNVCEVVYDELVENPERELRRICGFLNIHFEPAMLDLKSADVSNVPIGEHHAGVRSGVIAKAASVDENLPPAFVAKGQRYAKLWREKYSRSGFARVLTTNQGINPPGAIEQLADRCVRLLWRCVDSVKLFIFRRIPLSAWARLRSATPRGHVESSPPRD